MSESELSEREVELTGLVTEAFPEHAVVVRPIEVVKLEGGTQETLRFVLDDAYSSDVERQEITDGADLEVLADSLIDDLKFQMG